MNRMFRNKKISILLVAAALVLLILVCMLLITLTQLTALNQRAERLQAQIKEECAKEVEVKDLIEFMQTPEYVKRWAENNGRISKDDILWIAEQLSSKN